MKKGQYILLLLMMVTFFTESSEAQSNRDTVPSGGVEILWMNKGITRMEENSEIRYMYGDVVIKQDDVYIYCDSGTVQGKIVNAWSNVVIKQGDSLNIFGDKLFYNGHTKIAELERNVVLENVNQKLFTRKLRYDVFNKVATYAVGATLTDDKTYLRSKRGSYFVRTKDAYFRDSVVVVDPEFSLKTDTLRYNTEGKIAYFMAPTLITYDNSRIYTEGGYYEVEKKYAVFDKNPQYLSENQRSKADKIIYDGNLKEILLIGQARFEEEEKVATADTIHFFEETDIIDLIGNAKYIEGQKVASGERLIYNRKNGQFSSPGRTYLIDPPQFLWADSLGFEDESGLGIAKGQVHWQDTAQNIQIFCEEVRYQKADEYIKAWGGRPLLVVEMDGKNLFVAGDTLLSFKKVREATLAAADSNLVDTLTDIQSKASEEMAKDVAATDKQTIKDTNKEDRTVKSQPPRKVTEKDLGKLYQYSDITEKDTAFIAPQEVIIVDTLQIDLDTFMDDSLSTEFPVDMDSLITDVVDTVQDTIKMMLVYHNVLIYQDKMRGMCDSLVYHSVDSIFNFYRNPVFWSDSTQFKGDTMSMILQDKKLHRMDLLSNALVISTDDEAYFNQISGKLVNAYFEEGEIDNVLVTGNAETIYYVKDDDGAYNGLNSKQASRLRIFFEEKEMQNIRFYAQPTGKFIPMSKADHEGLKLNGFSWDIDKSPGSLEALTDLEWIPWELLMPDDEEEAEDEELIIEEATEEEQLPGVEKVITNPNNR